MPDFSKARVGDKCYHLRWGECTIQYVSCDKNQEMVRVNGRWFTFKGFETEEDLLPMLYHSRPVISDPPPPKRRVKKTMWGNFYPSLEPTQLSTGLLYSTEAEAKENAGQYSFGIFSTTLEYEEE
jgi:hypothetical protein